MYQKLLLSVFFVLYGFLTLAQNNPFGTINSAYDEQNPILSPDGQTIYFTRSNHPENVGGERDPGDIWYSVLGPNGWSKPIHSNVLNSYDWNGVIGFIQNGDVMVLHNHYATGSLLKTQGIALSEKNRNGWSKPENINIPYFKNYSKYFGGSLSSQGDVLVFSLESYGTKGAEDIYVSFKKGKKWSEPKNLGKTINTEFQELTPFIYSDSLLYFSSNGLGGQGSTDVFMTRRLDDTWLSWSKPEQVETVNTDGRELGYRQYDGFAIYTSTVNSDGYGDIKLYTEADVDTLFNQQPQEEGDINIVEAKPEDLPANVIVLYGTVTSKTDDKPLKAKVSVVSQQGKSVKTKVDEELYMSNLKSPGSYTVTVAAPGYIAEQENIELLTAEAKKLQLNFALQPIAVGARVNLKNVLFKQSKAEMLESSYPQLNMVVDLMKQNPDIKIRLEGHTDNRGVAKHNLRLSKMRVEAVEDYLVSKGIASKRIKGKGYGGSRPIADNDDPELRKLNRRVEFTIIKD